MPLIDEQIVFCLKMRWVAIGARLFTIHAFIDRMGEETENAKHAHTIVFGDDDWGYTDICVERYPRPLPN